MPQKHNPAKLRKRIREARREVPKHYATQASYRFSEQVAELPSYQSAKTIAGFLPFDGEADPLPLMDRALMDGKAVFVPIILGKSKPLVFARWDREVKLKSNRFGIDEPVFDPSALVQGSQIECVMTPLVAFDEACNRVGVGGGFYDRTFAFLKDPSHSACSLVGIAYEMQKVDGLKVQEHDVPLDYIVTELAVYEAN